MALTTTAETAPAQKTDLAEAKFTLNAASVFGRQAEAYALFRPGYPRELIAALSALTNSQDFAVDLATGTGQLAGLMSGFFKKVHALDHDAAMIAQAAPAENLVYAASDAANTGLPGRCANLITAGNAIHWLDSPEFTAEMRRITAPGGVFVAIQHTKPEMPEALLKIIYGKLDAEIIAPYKAPALVKHNLGFAGVELPFEQSTTLNFVQSENWTFDHLIGFLNTWSACITYAREEGHLATDKVKEELLQAWGDPAATIEVRFPVTARVAIKPLD